MKNTYAIKAALAALGLALAASTMAQGTAAAAAGKTASDGKIIVLGQSVPLTGPAKDLGVKMQAGAKAYFDFVNSQGGVNGSKIELRTKDDGYEPDRAKKNTEQFVSENVFALFGYVGTPTSNASRPVFEAAKLPFLFAFTGTGALRAPLSPLIFNLRASYGQEAERMVDHLVGFGINKIAIFYQNDAYGQAGLAGVKAAMDKRKLTLAAEGTVERNSIEVAAGLKTVSDVNPQAVIMVSTYGATSAFVKAYKATGKAPPQFFNVSFVGTAALQAALDQDAEGVMVAEVVPPFMDQSLASVREFTELMKASKQEKLIDYTSFEGFLAAKVTVEGLKKAGANPNREALIKGLEQVRNFNIGDVYINFDEKRHSGSDYVDLIMLKNNGTIVY
jgi:branched-chain amino acid transport system substrate-binding protein